jgi:hypothetical protein
LPAFGTPALATARSVHVRPPSVERAHSSRCVAMTPPRTVLEMSVTSLSPRAASQGRSTIAPTSTTLLWTAHVAPPSVLAATPTTGPLVSAA